MDSDHDSAYVEDIDLFTDADPAHGPDLSDPNIQLASFEKREAFLDRLHHLWLKKRRTLPPFEIDFPEGYELYTIQRGNRLRWHLYGHFNHYRFESTNEFLPHYVHLVGVEKGPCRCKYCHKAWKPLGYDKQCSCDWCTARAEYAPKSSISRQTYLFE